MKHNYYYINCFKMFAGVYLDIISSNAILLKFMIRVRRFEK